MPAPAAVDESFAAGLSREAVRPGKAGAVSRRRSKGTDLAGGKEIFCLSFFFCLGKGGKEIIGQVGETRRSAT